MEQVTDPNSTQFLGGITATTAGIANSEVATEVARSLFTANFEQIITFQFHLQMGDVIGLIGLLLAIDAYRSRKRKT